MSNKEILFTPFKIGNILNAVWSAYDVALRI